jgi:hypothetical protein
MKTLILVALVVSVMLVLSVGTVFAAGFNDGKNETWERGGASSSEIGGASGGSALLYEDGSVDLYAFGAE